MKLDRRILIIVWIALLFVGVIIFFISLRSVPLDEVILVLSNLQPWKIITLLVVNTAILILVPLRWWLILKAQSYRVPYLALSRYRLEASAISYISPGQHFGGEPLQVISLRNRHKVKGSAALASVTLDRAIEIFGNFTVLALGITFVITTGIVPGFELRNALLLTLLVLVLPVTYLAMLWLGLRPIGRVLNRSKRQLANGIRNAEDQLADLIRKKPSLFGEGIVVSALVWVSVFFEFWLALDFLGLRLDGSQLVFVVTASRVALFAPTPGALGALEASQMLSVQALGFDPAIGLSLGLLIRARDIFFAVIGLLLGGLNFRLW